MVLGITRIVGFKLSSCVVGELVDAHLVGPLRFNVVSQDLGEVGFEDGLALNGCNLTELGGVIGVTIGLAGKILPCGRGRSGNSAN